MQLDAAGKEHKVQCMEDTLPFLDLNLCFFWQALASHPCLLCRCCCSGTASAAALRAVPQSKLPRPVCTFPENRSETAWARASDINCTDQSGNNHSQKKKKKKMQKAVTVATPLGVRGVKARSAAGSSARTDGLLLGRRMCQVSGPFTTEVMSVLLQWEPVGAQCHAAPQHGALTCLTTGSSQLNPTHALLPVPAFKIKPFSGCDS